MALDAPGRASVMRATDPLNESRTRFGADVTSRTSGRQQAAIDRRCVRLVRLLRRAGTSHAHLRLREISDHLYAFRVDGHPVMNRPSVGVTDVVESESGSHRRPLAL